MIKKEEVPRITDAASLLGFRRIIVLANCEIEGEISILDDDLLIVFNNPTNIEMVRSASNILWVHRYNEAGKEYFGQKLVGQFGSSGHTCIVNSMQDFNVAPLWCDELIHSLSDIDGLQAYPVGKRIAFTVKAPVRIESPSTGFIVLTILSQHQKQGHPIRVIAVGFGGLPNGWKGHAWSYERKKMSTMGIQFLDRRLNNVSPRRMRLIGSIPDVAIRFVSDAIRFSKGMIGRVVN